MTSVSKIALALAGAAAAGVVIGLMLAPEKGSETRKKVKDKAGKMVDGLNRYFSRTDHNGEMDHENQDEFARGKSVSTAME